MRQPTASEVVELLGVDSSTLPLATEDEVAAAGAGLADRVSLPCVGCGAPAEVMLVASNVLGHRWVDLCSDCFHWATARR